MLLDPLVVLVLSLGMGFLFLGACLHKIREFAQFRVILAEYRLLPDVLVVAAAGSVVLVELILSAGWLSMFWLPMVAMPVAVTSALLLTLYGLAVGINLARGRNHISCGCGVPGANNADQPLSSGILIRNGALSLLALIAVLPFLERSLFWFDYLTAVTALLIAAVLYKATSQLLSNGAAMASWRHQMAHEAEPGG